MSTRTTRAQAAAASTSASKSSSPTSKPVSQAKGRSTQSTKQANAHLENDKAAMNKSRSKRSNKVVCSCKGTDDGTPMVACCECDELFHFSCVNLSTRDADDLAAFVCPACSENTGRRTTMIWEGPNALEQVIMMDDKPARHKPAQVTKKIKADESSDSDDSSSTEDEYVVQSNRSKPKRAARRLSFSSDSEAESTSAKHNLKRKAPSRSHESNPSKKSKTTTSNEDPTRSYCVTRFQQLFRTIFLRYPHVHIDGAGAEVEKKEEDLTDSEKESVISSANQFATELEECVFDIYCEPDRHVGAKYKDRFRTIDFNLSKVDRVLLHKRIVSGQITPKEISTMSSTDLADEDTKQSIKIAEQAALEHSILQKTSAPRAKITHKGFQDIEDVNGSWRDGEREHEREVEEQQRMESERFARLRAAQQVMARQRTASVSVPPESPVTPQSASWGAPPPVPMSTDVSASYLEHTSTEAPSEPELNLADLINIDDDPMVDIQPGSEVLPTLSITDADTCATATATSASPTIASPVIGISPFASRPSLADASKTSSFDLNSIWGPAPTKDTKMDVEQPVVSDEPARPVDSTLADDHDFDMFLEEKEPERPMSPQSLQAAYDSRPVVWTGKITMPLDSSIPSEAPVEARQAGGRPLEVGSTGWRVLFPSQELMIAGRTPVAESAQFILQLRLNPAKELISVAFSPSGSDVEFKQFSDFLINKGRHGLVFPWGQRATKGPGRELYVIPLLASHPLPDYIELLNHLVLPKFRQKDYMIGIWIMNKDAVMKAPPEAPAAKVSSPPGLPPVQSTPPIPAISALSSLLAPPTVNVPAPPALAAEVAALTPEQIQQILQKLAPSIPLVIPPPSAPVNVAPLVRPGPMWPPSHIPQIPPYVNPNAYTPPPPQAYPNSPVHYHDRAQRGGGSPYDHRGGADRGRGRGRGRARGREGPNNETGRPVDSGWPRRRPDGTSPPGKRP